MKIFINLKCKKQIIVLYFISSKLLWYAFIKVDLIKPFKFYKKVMLMWIKVKKSAICFPSTNTMQNNKIKFCSCMYCNYVESA